MTWFSRSGRTAVPIAKNSVVCAPQVWLCCRSWTPTMPSACNSSASACMRGVAGPDQGPEVLPGQVGGERLALVVAPVVDAAAARVRLGLDRGADRDELGG